MTNLIVSIVITFQTNCQTFASYNDGRREERCIVERVCSVNHDLGDGQRLEFAVTNVVEEFTRAYTVRRRHHPVLGPIEEREEKHHVMNITPPQGIVNQRWANGVMATNGLFVTPPLPPRIPQ